LDSSLNHPGDITQVCTVHRFSTSGGLLQTGPQFLGEQTQASNARWSIYPMSATLSIVSPDVCSTMDHFKRPSSVCVARPSLNLKKLRLSNQASNDRWNKNLMSSETSIWCLLLILHLQEIPRSTALSRGPGEIDIVKEFLKPTRGEI